MNYLLLKYIMFRCNMFSHALILYQNTLVNFWEKTAKTMNHVNNGFKVNHRPNYRTSNSVADPGFLSRIPESVFFPSRIRIFFKEFKYCNPKKWFLSGVVHPGSGSWFFTHPGSRIQGSKRHRIRVVSVITTPRNYA